DRPLTFGHNEVPLYSAARRKIDPSHAREMRDGSWRGIFTVYSPAPDIVAEYTAEVSAPSLRGPWTFVGTGIRFKPCLGAISWSAENPTPLKSDASCAK